MMFLTESRQDGRAICNLLMMIEQTLEDKKPLETFWFIQRIAWSHWKQNGPYPHQWIATMTPQVPLVSAGEEVSWKNSNN